MLPTAEQSAEIELEIEEAAAAAELSVAFAKFMAAHYKRTAGGSAATQKRPVERGDMGAGSGSAAVCSRGAHGSEAAANLIGKRARRG